VPLSALFLLQYVFLVVHVAACLLYYSAVQGGFDSKNTWVGAAAFMTEGKTTAEM
jgi:hypothetical protein